MRKLKIISLIRNVNKALMLPLLLTLFSTQTLADEKANKIIQKSIEAYGGVKLLNMHSLTLEETSSSYAQWQSNASIQGATISYLSENKTEYAIDFSNNRKVFKQATTKLVGNHHSNFPSVKHRLFTNGAGYSIDHILQEVKQSKNISFANADRLVDTLIIKQLYQDMQYAQWEDMAYIEGKPQDIITINKNSRNEYTVFIDKDSKYLTQLILPTVGRLTSYNYLNHTKSNGIVWAQSLFIGNTQQPVSYSNSRKVSFNSTKLDQFNIPLNYKTGTTKEYFDSSALTVNKIADNIYFAGQDWGYTLFIDTGSYLISAGAWQTDDKSNAWRNALALFRETTGNIKPLKQHIVTHHHFDHMMGLKDVVEQGVDLIVHKSLIAAVEEHLGASIPKESLVTIDDTSYLANDSVMLFDLPTSHANHNLAVYLPEQKILFTEDIFGSSFKSDFHSPANWPDGDTYFRLDTLLAQLNDLKIAPTTFLSSHHARVLSVQDIQQALAVERPSNNVLLKRLFAIKQ